MQAPNQPLKNDTQSFYRQSPSGGEGVSTNLYFLNIELYDVFRGALDIIFENDMRF